MAELDIERFRRNLATKADEAKRKMFLILLVNEEALTGINSEWLDLNQGRDRETGAASTEFKPNPEESPCNVF